MHITTFTRQEGPHPNGAISAFRAQQLIDQLQLSEHLGLQVKALHARHHHLVATRQALDATDRERLGHLLDARPSDLADSSGSASNASNQVIVAVTPWLATVSPWASKATDIARNCGLGGANGTSLIRVERITEYTLTLATRSGADASAWQHIAAILHDRMTESVFDRRSAALALFDEQAAAPLAWVDLMGQGINALEVANRDWGLALADDEMAYLLEAYRRLGRNPSDV